MVTTHLILSLSARFLSAAINSAMNLWLMAFFFSGRLKVNHATPASSSTRRRIVVISVIASSHAVEFLSDEYQKSRRIIKWQQPRFSEVHCKTYSSFRATSDLVRGSATRNPG